MNNLLILPAILLLAGGACNRMENMQENTETFSLSNQKQRYLQDLEFISKRPRFSGNRHHKEVQKLCAKKFEALGFDVELHDYGSGVNVIGVYPGKQNPHEKILVSAHYDSVPECNGADDNASGIAGVFETARILATKSHDRTLIVACWDEEESGLIGSKAYVEREKNKQSDFKMSFVYEMIAYKSDKPNTQQIPAGFEQLYPEQVNKIQENQNRGDFILLVYDQQSGEMLSNIRAHADNQNLPLLKMEVPSNLIKSTAISDLRRSDHAAFWDEGYPAMMITDTANFRNPNYHCINGADNSKSLDINFAIKTINALSKTIAEALAK